MQTLSRRLYLAASFVKTGSRVCDVGTDHGYLPVFLHKQNRCEYICATEINEKPFLNAKLNFKKENADIDIFLCDGLEAVASQMVDTVIITGMGGLVISGIIKRAPFLYKSGVSLILQPMTDVGELREFLAKSGFVIENEQAVVDKGRVYTVMCAAFSGVPYKLTPAKRRIGQLSPTSEANIAYIKRQERLCRELCTKLKSIGEKKELLKTEESALFEITRILG